MLRTWNGVQYGYWRMELDGTVRTAATAALLSGYHRSLFPSSLFSSIGVWWFKWASSGGKRISIDQLVFGGPLAGLLRSGRRYQSLEDAIKNNNYSSM